MVWGKWAGIEDESRLWGRIRHRDPGAAALVRQSEANVVEAVFETPRTAIAPGQAAVFYDGDDVVAGGWIDRPEAPPEGDGFLALPTL